MQFPTYIIDTFTSERFRGNPTAVCCVDKNVQAGVMQSTATELDLPVTAFIARRDMPEEYDIKYFTPTTEIPACGHATLAAAKTAGIAHGVETPVFHTINNIAIKAIAEGDAIMMSYPVYQLQPFIMNDDLLKSLGLNNYKSAGYCSELEALFIELDAETLRKVQPDYTAMVRSNDMIKEVVLTSESDEKEYDYLLRSFCPWIGIDEDPVTGSVHSVLAGFWKERLNKHALVACQASERGGEILVRNYNDRIEIGGRMTMQTISMTR
ncbi:MAG: PhzF family phenazine biosynthesis protein [Chitinophagaceae bacterium]